MDEKTTINLPAKFNLFDMVTVRPYNESQEYAKANDELKKKAEFKKKVKRTTNISIWVLLGALLLYLLVTGHTFLIWVAGIIGAIVCGVISHMNSPDDVSSELDTSKEDQETCVKIIDELIIRNFPGAKYITAWQKAVIYNNEIFAYLSLRENLLVLYSQKNFRGITWKEIEGSHDYGDLYDFQAHSGVATVRYMGKGYKNEYFVELTTNYMDYPIIKFCVPATSDYNEKLKIMGSVIS